MKISLPFLLICSILVCQVGAQTLVDSFPSPSSEPRGLAWDGEYLWCADAKTDSVYQLHPNSGRVISSFSVKVDGNYGGITWGGDGTVWLANGAFVYQLDPVTGDTVDGFSCPGG